MQNAYREPLPPGCPPEEAEDINAPRSVFRLVRNKPPMEDDFMSQRYGKPNHIFNNISECQARGLSVHSTVQASEKIRKLPRMRKQRMKVCRVALDKGSGHIQKTGRDPYHFTWWPLADFDILGNCSTV